MINLGRFCLFSSLVLLLVLVSTALVHAQTTGPERVLIRNVLLIDPNGVVEDKVVNILIRNNKLDIVTEDKISSSEADMVVNANSGVILGKLEVGQRPSFIIFHEDPRSNFRVMMDTSTYSVFAVDEGVVVKNRLIGVVADEPEDEQEPKKSGWLAYTPPPVMVPLNYQDPTKWNQFITKYINGTFISAILFDRVSWLSQDEASKDQVGDLELYDGGEIRAFRFGFVGTLNFKNPWVYTVFVATRAFDKGFEVRDEDSLTLYDFRLDIPFFKNSVMSIGKQKAPISMDRLIGGIYMTNQERAAVSDALLPSRNIGIVWNGSSSENYTSWAFGVFNDWLEKKDGFDESATQFIGRFTWAPLVSEDGSNLLHLGFGYRYSDAKQGFQYLTEPEFQKAPIFVDTGFHPADKTDTYSMEVAWRRGPTTLTSEYTQARVKNPDLGNPSFSGYYVTAAWALTGEMRPYNKKSGIFSPLPVAKSVYQDGKGALEFYTRYSDLDLDDGHVDGGEMQVATLGLTWWLTNFSSVGVGYKYIWNEKNGDKGESSGLMVRLTLVLD